MDTKSFKDEGFLNLGSMINPRDCAVAHDKIALFKDLGPHIFIDEKHYRENKAAQRKTGSTGNVLDHVDMSFLEKNPEFVHTLKELLGENYTVLARRVICGVPTAWIPDWVVHELMNNDLKNFDIPNLSCFIRDEYRYLRYLAGIDFHQDIHDFKNTDSDMITVYVYLDQVSDKESPLYIMPKSHMAGASAFPHRIQRTGEHAWKFKSDHGDVFDLSHQALHGGPGTCYLWHGCLLHGTLPSIADRPRLSLRYIFGMDPKSKDCIMAQTNAAIKRPLSLENPIDFTRDLNMNHRAISELRGEGAQGIF